MSVVTEKSWHGEPDTEGALCILSITPEGEGEMLTVAFTRGGGETLRLHLLVEQYAELGLRRGEVSPEQAEALLEAGRLCGAIRRGISLLQYGDQSRRRLTDKLVARGISREISTAAVAYLAERGYIREDDTACLRAEQGLRKLWGPLRIREDLRAHGFSVEVTEEALEGLSEVDWVENCVAAIRKKNGEIPADRQQRQKLMAAVLRLGYDGETVKEAMRRILREE